MYFSGFRCFRKINCQPNSNCKYSYYLQDSNPDMRVTHMISYVCLITITLECDSFKVWGSYSNMWFFKGSLSLRPLKVIRSFSFFKVVFCICGLVWLLEDLSWKYNQKAKRSVYPVSALVCIILDWSRKWAMILNCNLGEKSDQWKKPAQKWKLKLSTL